MLNKRNRKAKIIDGNEHIGEIPKEKGLLSRYVVNYPLWVMILLLIIFIFVEMLGFAYLYSVISSSSFMDSLDYSLFSALGEKVPTSIKNATLINRLISVQSILTNCIISFYMALVLYKLISIKPKLIKMEKHVIFDPKTGTLRLRVANVSRFYLTNVRVNTNFRIYLRGGGRYANAKLKLKTDTMSLFCPYTAWNIATKPFLPKDENETQLDISRYDSERLYEFIPDLLNKEYCPADEEPADKIDFRKLDVIITIKSPLFGVEWDYCKSFFAKDFVCGEIISLIRKGSGVTDWSNWEEYKDKSENYCEKCAFAGHCSIIKMSQKYKTIN